MRDYCQHGEPMDEHCAQCAGHTKAAAMFFATAPVPAGGTPEGLAREKVEMTDSEVKQARRAVQDDGPSVSQLEDALRESVTFRNIRAGMVDTEDVDCRGLALQLAHILQRNRARAASPLNEMER